MKNSLSTKLDKQFLYCSRLSIAQQICIKRAKIEKLQTDIDILLKEYNKVSYEIEMVRRGEI